jgi:hypothetical protein
VGDGLRETEHVLRAMIDFMHQKENLVLLGFPIGHVLGEDKKQASLIGCACGSVRIIRLP